MVRNEEGAHTSSFIAAVSRDLQPAEDFDRLQMPQPTISIHFFLIAWDLQPSLQAMLPREASPLPCSLPHTTISQCTAVCYTALQRGLSLISTFPGNKGTPQQTASALIDKSMGKCNITEKLKRIC